MKKHEGDVFVYLNGKLQPFPIGNISLFLASHTREVVEEIQKKVVDCALEGRNDKQVMKGILLYNRILKMLASFSKKGHL